MDNIIIGVLIAYGLLLFYGCILHKKWFFYPEETKWFNPFIFQVQIRNKYGVRGIVVLTTIQILSVCFALIAYCGAFF